MRPWLIMGGGVLLLAVSAAAILTRPQRLDPAAIAAIPAGDATRGEAVFWASGCASCHAVPGAKDDAKLVLAGGLALNTDFGTFVAPNISPSRAAGIGSWTIGEFANAMLKGVSPERTHYYPAFPYNAYQRMTDQDIADLWAFMQTLPESENVPPGNALGFPFSIRAAVGGWKLLLKSSAEPVVALDGTDPVLARGQYLVEGPGHCGECHTPRNVLGGLKDALWLSGAANPDGEGRIPNITPGARDISGWSEADLVAYFETGFTPDFDSVGGSMVSVQQNLSKLRKSDLQAIAAYLKAIPAIAD